MIFEWIAEMISEVNDMDVSAISPEDRFTDLGIDSLDTVEMLMNLEEKTGIEIIPDENWETINDLVLYVQQEMSKKI